MAVRHVKLPKRGLLGYAAPHPFLRDLQRHVCQTCRPDRWNVAERLLVKPGREGAPSYRSQERNGAAGELVDGWSTRCDEWYDGTIQR